MDPRLLQAYNDELVYLRETAREFGTEHPGVAGRLGLDAAGEVDPHVERLLEGVAFLSARVQLKLKDQFPDFTQHLLHAVQPHYLAPTPSMCVVGFDPHEGDSALIAGVPVPRGVSLRALASDRDASPVTFQTGHDVTLWPLQVREAEYLPSRAAVAPYLSASDADDMIEAGIRLRIGTTGGVPLAQLRVTDLPVYLDGSGAVPGELYRQLIGDTVAVLGRAPDARGGGIRLPLPAQHGFGEECALLPAGRRSHRGYRLLGEYFGCPERFLFVRIDQPGDIFATCDGDACDIIFLLRRPVPALAGALSSHNFRLFATPAVNLFEKQLDRVQVTGFEHECQLIADRTRPLNYEVWRILDVKAHGQRADDVRPVQPLHDFAGLLYDWSEAIFYVPRLRSRRLSTREQRARRRDDYVGSETWISLTAPANPQRLEQVTELSVRALVTNRELPALMRGSAALVADGLPARSVTMLRAPTAPRPPLGIGDAAWRVVNHLTPNYTGFASDPAGSPDALRGHLALYGRVDDVALRRQIDGIRSVTSRRVSRRIPRQTPLSLVRGQQLRITLDEAAFENSRMFLFSAVLERFLSEFAAVNSFTETIFDSNQRGSFMQWPARIGHRPTI